MSGEVGRRCAMGCETWPAKAEFETCPTCRAPTRLYRSVHPIDEAIAILHLRHAEFNEFYDTQWVKDEEALTASELTALGL